MKDFDPIAYTTRVSKHNYATAKTNLVNALKYQIRDLTRILETVEARDYCSPHLVSNITSGLAECHTEYVAAARLITAIEEMHTAIALGDAK